MNKFLSHFRCKKYKEKLSNHPFPVACLGGKDCNIVIYTNDSNLTNFTIMQYKNDVLSAQRCSPTKFIKFMMQMDNNLQYSNSQLFNDDISMRIESVLKSIPRVPSSERFYEVTAVFNKKTQETVLYYMDITKHMVSKQELLYLVEKQWDFIRSMYPKHIVDIAMRNDIHDPATLKLIARKHTNISILFADIVGFTTFCSNVNPEITMNFLNKLFTAFDANLLEHDVYKIETIGDCYVAATGLVGVENHSGGCSCIECLHESCNQKPSQNIDNGSIAATNIIQFARVIMGIAATTLFPYTTTTVKIRIGVHTGDVTSGIIDSNVPRFQLFGDTMNTASRMESTAKPMHIQISETTYKLINCPSNFKQVSVDVKGKGNMNTYTLMYDYGSKIQRSECTAQNRILDLFDIAGSSMKNLRQATNTRDSHNLE